MEQIRIESVEVKQMERQSAGSRDVEGEAVVVHFAAVAVAAVCDLAVESILQVKQVEVDFEFLKQVEEELVSAIPTSPDTAHTEEEAAAVVAGAAAAAP